MEKQADIIPYSIEKNQLDSNLGQIQRQKIENITGEIKPHATEVNFRPKTNNILLTPVSTKKRTIEPVGDLK